MSSTVFRGGAKQFARHHNRGFAMKFNDFRNAIRLPAAKLFGSNTSVLTATLCHDLSDLRRWLFVPVQRDLFPKIEIADQQNCNVHHHFVKAVAAQSSKNHRPWVKENGFHVEKDKDHRYQVKLHGKRLARVSGWLHSPFIRLLFGAVWPAPADQYRKAADQSGQDGGDQEVQDPRPIALQT